VSAAEVTGLHRDGFTRDVRLTQMRLTEVRWVIEEILKHCQPVETIPPRLGMQIVRLLDELEIAEPEKPTTPTKGST